MVSNSQRGVNVRLQDRLRRPHKRFLQHAGMTPFDIGHDHLPVDCGGPAKEWVGKNLDEGLIALCAVTAFGPQKQDVADQTAMNLRCLLGIGNDLSHCGPE